MDHKPVQDATEPDVTVKDVKVKEVKEITVPHQPEAIEPPSLPAHEPDPDAPDWPKA